MVEGVDTVDASNVNYGFMGHSYVAEMRPVIADIRNLMVGDVPPGIGIRKELRAVDGDSGRYWEFKP